MPELSNHHLLLAVIEVIIAPHSDTGLQNLGMQSPHFVEEKLWIREAFSSFLYRIMRQADFGLEPYALVLCVLPSITELSS